MSNTNTKSQIPPIGTNASSNKNFVDTSLVSTFMNVDLAALDPEDDQTNAVQHRLQVVIAQLPLMRNFKLESKLAKLGVTGGLGFVFFNEEVHTQDIGAISWSAGSMPVWTFSCDRSWVTMFRSKIKNCITMITSLKRAIKDRS